MALFAAMIGLGALVTIPFVGPVPFTLQPLIVLLTGMVLGPRLGPVSVLVYLTLGLVAPVYAGGQAGIGVLIGPTGGYLAGFVLAAWVAGIIAYHGPPSFAQFAVAGLVGLIPVYALGATWLAMHLEITSVWGVLVTGVLQFVPLDVVKALLAAGLAGALVSSPLGLPGLRRDR
ncbi:MAG: biotin transporter BioY [Verrucomicrobia bacterium]|nr:biotin transporter BioY [Verrucomicrobiota bacterium]